jgi:hypothetical protein
MAMFEEFSKEDEDVSPSKALPQFNDPIPPFDPLEVESLISLNALIGIFTPQNIKLIGYIKNWKVIILFDNRNNYYFVHHHIAQENLCYIRVVNNL